MRALTGMMKQPLLAATTRPPLDKVLVTVGDGNVVSALGLHQGQRRWMIDDPNALGFSAVTAAFENPETGRLEYRYYVDRDSPPDAPVFKRVGSDEVVSIAEIDAEVGSFLRAGKGPRILDSSKMAPYIKPDMGGHLAYNLEAGSKVGGLRDHTGLTKKNLQGTPLNNMASLLFTDSKRFPPSLQAQLFVVTIMGSLLALGRPLPRMIDPWDLRVFASTCFSGEDSRVRLGVSYTNDFATRLATWLNTHGPFLAGMMLAPGLSHSEMLEDPALLTRLFDASAGLFCVPQAADVASAACASALVSFCNLANAMLADRYASAHPPKVALWSSADAILTPPYLVQEGFGANVLMTTSKIQEERDVSSCFCPFDKDAAGTLVGNAGAACLVTTAEFAMRHGLDITSAFIGWGQSAESGAPKHSSGVGFGGENAMISALKMAFANFGIGVQALTRFNAHATSTSVGSKTDLKTAIRALLVRAAQEQGIMADEDFDKLYNRYKDRLPNDVKLSASKAAGHVHTMGPCGLIAAVDGNYYLRGEPAVGVPNFRTLHPAIGEEASHFDISASPVAGNDEGVELIAVQGFGGPNGAILRTSANRDFLKSLKTRNKAERKLVDQHLERMEDIRSRRIAAETRELRQQGWALRSALRHRWANVKDA